MELNRENYPLITVIVPLYNAKKYISETIESVINQTYKNWEMIIVDDCSTDNSINIIKKYQAKDSRIKLIKLKSNFGGPARPRNIGIKNTQGDYVAFLDADDIWDKDKLKIQLSYMLKNNYKFTSTNSKFIDKNSNSINTIKYKILAFIKSFNSKKTICDLIKNKFIATSSVMIKKDFIALFDEDKDLISVEDLCLWLKLLDSKEIKYFYIKEKLLLYRVLEDSISSRTNTHKQTTKANICILKFILHHHKYDMVNCFYSNIVKIKWIMFLKRILGNRV